MEDVPRVEPEIGSQEQRETQPVEHEPAQQEYGSTDEHRRAPYRRRAGSRWSPGNTRRPAPPGASSRLGQTSDE